MKAHQNLTATALTFVLALTALALPALAAGGVVNVNKASASELTLLPRIGPALAARILDYREENGGFKSVEDLLLVSGIGEKTYELLRHWIATTGDTTLTSKVNLAIARERAAEGGSNAKTKDDAEKQEEHDQQ